MSKLKNAIKTAWHESQEWVVVPYGKPPTLKNAFEIGFQSGWNAAWEHAAQWIENTPKEIYSEEIRSMKE